jgi:ubiquitin carboxyl-terminal hydrolase 2/21
MEGLNNLGSTCAINSLIQIFVRNDKLRNLILDSNTPEGSFTNELKEIIDLLYNKKHSLSPDKFINCLYSKFNGIFNRYEQIDINELWFYIYKIINEETFYENKNKINKNEIKNLIDDYEYNLNIYNDNKKSNIMNLVQGSYINIIQCSNCNNKTHLFEPFITLSLDIEDNSTIIELIVNFMKNEYREKDDWYCENCKQKTAYIKTTRIWKIPEVLFISLNRFKDINKKNNSEVIINEYINFNEGTILNQTNDIKFKLDSVGLHYGNIDGGHYTALCNMKNGLYHLFNDNNVNVIKEKDLFNNFRSCNAYLVIYNSINNT